MTRKKTVRVALLITLGIVVLLYSGIPPIAFPSFAQHSQSTECTVPDVLELPEDYARQRIAEALSSEPTITTEEEKHSYISAGHVIRQNSEGESPCDIVLTVSSGKTPSPTLLEVRSREYLRCGINSETLVNFSEFDGAERGNDESGDYYIGEKVTGFDPDFCRVVAAAVFSEKLKSEELKSEELKNEHSINDFVRFYPLKSAERFDAVASGKVDVLFRNTTWTAVRDTKVYTHTRLDFGPVIYHDAQRFMVPRKFIEDRNLQGDESLDDYTSGTKMLALANPITSVLTNTTFFVLENTTTLKNLKAHFGLTDDNGRLEIRESDAHTAYAEESDDNNELGNNKAYTSDTSQLIAKRKNGDHIIIAKPISREPFAPVVRQDDPQWRDIVSWAIFATIYAEELEVTSETVGNTTEDHRIQRLLGEGDFDENYVGDNLGLKGDFAYYVIKDVGNYGEIFEKHFCKEETKEETAEDCSIIRGPNKAWNKGEGGVLSSPPF